MSRKKVTSKQERKATQQREKRNQRILWGGILTGGLVILVGLITSLSSQPSYDIDPADPQLVALGQQVYETQCAGCHGLDLEGEADWNLPSLDGLLKAPPHDENGHTWHHNNAYLIDSIAKGGARLPSDAGVSAMPAYENILSEEEIGAVLSYIQSTWPVDILSQQSQR
ncbi:MAG: cytochrome c [Ardenticatenaceae bacterium]|nr:MAG: cytochrome c [Ardenticatenaceae bacterium]